MAMFEREKIKGDGAGTIVGSNVRLTGILKDTNDITVHGEVEGEIISDQNVMITETATIKGPITAENVIVAGTVHGAVTARDKLEITPSGKIYGAIAMKDLTIRSGAIFIGKSTMPDQRKTAPAAPPTKSVTTKEPDRQSEPISNSKKAVAKSERTKVLTYEIEE